MDPGRSRTFRGLRGDSGEPPGCLRSLSLHRDPKWRIHTRTFICGGPKFGPRIGWDPAGAAELAKSPRFYIEGGPLRDRASESAIFGAIAVKTRSQTRGFLGIRVIFGPLPGQTRGFLGILVIFGPISEQNPRFSRDSGHFRTIFEQNPGFSRDSGHFRTIFGA